MEKSHGIPWDLLMGNRLFHGNFMGTHGMYPIGWILPQEISMGSHDIPMDPLGSAGIPWDVSWKKRMTK